ncbi:MAG: hypothetical protein KF854_15375 [Nitrospira sp.]|nr:hypothetical protein [Nitrospira sp.]MBX3343158.1 hypothetical protein [Nitrospira sp.]MBX3351255.1 hypothetical protein [Nitrospira sp.]MBX3369755.1 hypothetical protein [Nitrospira sp.]
MTQEQFQHFWLQLKAPLKMKWNKITESDLDAIQGNLATFSAILRQRYGDVDNLEVQTWADRRHAVWSGNYIGYKDPEPVS